MDKRFNKIFEYILSVEGGYTNDPLDNGGETMYGVTIAEARRRGYKGDMRELPKEFAKLCYYEDYFLKNKLDGVLNSKIALSICDMAVNCGNATSTRKVQQALNNIGCNLLVDGIFGNKTLTTLNNINADEFLKEFHKLQAKYYNDIVKRRPNQIKFLKGWLNRIARKEKFLKEKC